MAERICHKVFTYAATGAGVPKGSYYYTGSGATCFEMEVASLDLLGGSASALS